MAWKCFNCGKIVDDISVVRCPHCGYRILVKERPPIVRRVKTD